MERQAMANVLVTLTLPAPIRERYANHLRATFPGLRVDLVDSHEKVDPFIGEADALVTFGPMMADHVFAKARKLKWVQALGSGVDGISDQPSFRPDIVLTNMRGIHGAPVAEAAIASMLALARDMPRSVRNQNKGVWERWPSRVLAGKTVVIVGVGLIAEALAPLCKAFGMTVVGVTGTPRESPGFDRMAPTSALLATLGAADHVVLLAPHTPRTHRMIGAAEFAAMRRGAFFVNLARGGVVDESALMEALGSGRIGAAALDVFDSEPLPADHPFYKAPNVLVTAHLGGFFVEYPDLAIPTLEENMRRFLAGDSSNMVNRVQ
jgi:phosphoglycerate dehydrogenase-like enzyme